jgi:hypothetical protein
VKCRCAALAITLCVTALTAAQAQATSAEEIAFWKSVSATNNPAELQAYLNAYPQGAFAGLAKNRLQQVPGQATMPAQSTPQAAQATAMVARVSPARTSFRLVDGVTLDLDASGLRNASNLRVTVVPASTPVAITDPDRLVIDSTPVTAAHLRLTIPSGPPGADEIRLYYIPNTGTEYQLAARAAVTIEPGFPGATLVRDLGHEAAQIGPVRFEANHRARPMLIQGAFLNVRPRTEWNMQWFQGVPAEQLSRQALVMTIGQPNVGPDIYGAAAQAVCVIAVADAATLNHVAALALGDPVLVAAIPTAWSNSGANGDIVLENCLLQQ